MEINLLLVGCLLALITYLFTITCLRRDEYVKYTDARIDYLMLTRQRAIDLLQSSLDAKNSDISLNSILIDAVPDVCPICGTFKSSDNKKGFGSCWYCGEFFGKKKKIEIILDKENGV